MKGKSISSNNMVSLPGCREEQRSSPEKRGTPEQPAAAEALHNPETQQPPHTAKPRTHTHTYSQQKYSPFSICLIWTVKTNSIPGGWVDVQGSSLKQLILTEAAAEYYRGQGGSAPGVWWVTGTIKYKISACLSVGVYLCTWISPGLDSFVTRAVWWSSWQTAHTAALERTALEPPLGRLTAPHSGQSMESVNATFLHVSIPNSPSLLPCIVFYTWLNYLWQEFDIKQPDQMNPEAEVIKGG